MKYILLIILLSCGDSIKTTPVEPIPTPIESLQLKYNTYKSLQYDSMRNDCDGLLFRSLMVVGGNDYVDITTHNIAKGEWVRSPDNKCETTSTISRDMMIGLIWWMWRTKQLQLAIELRDYAQNHVFKMGEGDTRVMMSPALYSTLLLVIDRLEGKLAVSNMPMVWDHTLTGYRGHLNILHILLRGELLGEVDAVELELINTYAIREPQNALYMYAYAKYVYGDYSKAIADLMDVKLFPDSELPTTNNRCDKWIWERMYTTDKDWIPCSSYQSNPEFKVHTGGDFLFVARLILDEIGGK